MFRPDADTLSNDLTELLCDVFRGTGRQLQVGANHVQIVRNPQGGDFGDCVFLSHTVDEYASRFGNNPPRARLPLLLRNRLQARGVGVFNPRGRSLRDIPVVQHLLGILLECIDPPNATSPDGGQQTAVNSHLRNESRIYLCEWRRQARSFIASNPQPTRPQRLQDFVAAWQRRTSQVGAEWPNEWPLLELCFKIISWIPMLRDDPEGQVYLEAVTRCVSQAATFSPFRSSIIFGRHPNVNNDLHFASVRRAIMDIIVPIAEEQVDVDEEIMPSVPRSLLPIMTIHQAKGLEYPLVIVDVSSDYNTNHRLNRFRRFPETTSAVQKLEDDLAPHCGIGPLRLARQGLARTFDDLVRLYYVAFSRPQSLLLLVGVDKCLRYTTTIRHVATGWRSDGTWAWVRPVAGPPPALANNIPLQLI
jgi:DNA helicase-2/ATP-dependent DNA helicase PcrA